MVGSMVNYLMRTSEQPEPVVGMGATIVMWSDRRAVTVIGVTRDHGYDTVRVQFDKVTRTDTNGMSEAQSYSYEPDPDGAIRVYTLRKNGRWVRRGETMSGETLLIGHREEYYDYSF